MKLTVKKAEQVTTSYIIVDAVENAGPWKEAKSQCL